MLSPSLVDVRARAARYVSRDAIPNREPIQMTPILCSKSAYEGWEPNGTNGVPGIGFRQA